jgi:hypothetical protein
VTEQAGRGQASRQGRRRQNATGPTASKLRYSPAALLGVPLAAHPVSGLSTHARHLFSLRSGLVGFCANRQVGSIPPVALTDPSPHPAPTCFEVRHHPALRGRHGVLLRGGIASKYRKAVWVYGNQHVLGVQPGSGLNRMKSSTGIRHIAVRYGAAAGGSVLNAARTHSNPYPLSPFATHLSGRTVLVPRPLRVNTRDRAGRAAAPQKRRTEWILQV